MAFCGNCGNQLPEGMKFCPNCGTAVANIENPLSIEPEDRKTVGNAVNEFQPIPHQIPMMNTRAMTIDPRTIPPRPETWLDKYGKFFGIPIFILSILDFMTDPPIFTIILSIMLISGSVFCLARKFKLKFFPIAAIVLSTICLIAGVFQAKKMGLFRTPEDSEYVESLSDREDQPAIAIEKSNEVKDNAKADKEVTYGNVVFNIPGKYLEKTQSLANEDIYETKDELAMFDMGLYDGSIDGSIFRSSEAQSLLESEFKTWIDGKIGSTTFETSQYRTVAGLDCIELKYSGTMDAANVKCTLAIINDEASNKMIPILHVYYDHVSNDYGSDLDTMLNGARSLAGSTTVQDKAGSDASAGKSNTSADGVDPKLKAALDEYEAFMNEYVDFMNKYSSDPGNALSMISDYTDMLAKYSDFATKINGMDTSNMSKADYAYYLDTLNRVEKKLLDVVP